MGGKENYYWDTCVFLALLKNESRDDPNILLGIQEQAKLFDENIIDITTSTITITEILPSNSPPGLLDNFLKITERRNFHLIDVTRKIVFLANRIRDLNHNGNNPNLDVPDSIHLASAIDFKCDAIYTLDGSRPDRKGLGLLQIPQPIAGEYNLPILKPGPKLPPKLPGIN